MSEVERIKRDLKNMLSEYRYLHSLRVADEARKLANTYHYDEDKAYITGLVHDIAKEFSDEENINMVNKYHLSKDLLDCGYRKILHCDIGACLIKDIYHMDDDICHAVKCHTIGDIPMNLLDKILFVADKIEPGKIYDGIDCERKAAYQDIHEATILCISNNHKKLIKKKKDIYPKSIEVLNYLKNYK